METIIQTKRNEIRKLPLENGCNSTEFVNGKIAGGIGVGGGTKEQDWEIEEYVLSVFEELSCP